MAINIQTDVNVSPAMLSKCSLAVLRRIAAEGTEQQRDCLLTWAYSGVCAEISEELHRIATLSRLTQG